MPYSSAATGSQHHHGCLVVDGAGASTTPQSSSSATLMAPEPGSDHYAARMGKVASSSSIDSIADAYASDCPSDDLDKLSMCLSEVSSDVGDGKKTSLLNDIIQAQLAFWTLIISIFYSYAWQQHRKKFLFSLIMIMPPVIVICCTVSSLLTTIVILGRIFATPLRFKDVLKFGSGQEDEEEMNTVGGSTSKYASMNSLANGSGNLNGMALHSANQIHRRRTFSGNSGANTIGSMIPIRRFDRSGSHGYGYSSAGNGGSGNGSVKSLSCEELALPKPVCRKHSCQAFSGSGALLGAGHHSSMGGSRSSHYGSFMTSNTGGIGGGGTSSDGGSSQLSVGSGSHASGNTPVVSPNGKLHNNEDDSVTNSDNDGSSSITTPPLTPSKMVNGRGGGAVISLNRRSLLQQPSPATQRHVQRQNRRLANGGTQPATSAALIGGGSDTTVGTTVVGDGN